MNFEGYIKTEKRDVLKGYHWLYRINLKLLYIVLIVVFRPILGYIIYKFNFNSYLSSIGS